MEVNFKKNGTTLEAMISGRLDTNTAPELEKKMEGIFDKSLEKLIFNFKDLEYVSSAGLRVILAVNKKTNPLGINFVIKNVNEEIMEVFEITGFLEILNIE